MREDELVSAASTNPFALMSKKLVILLFVLVGLGLASRSQAYAASEACPARILFWPAGQSASDRAIYNYELDALTERTVNATIIADTNHGWFGWTVQSVPVERKTYLVKQKPFHFTYKSAASQTLTVEFPANTLVSHAWIASASTSDESTFGWDLKGKVSCDLPDVSKQGIKPAAVEVHHPGDAAPLPPPGPAVATPVSQPFPPSSCKTPFSAASVPGVMQPWFPAGLVGVVRDPSAVILFVAIDENGRLADTWILASSGYAQMDDAALRATRQSRYTAGTAYCRSVGGVYMVVEEFDPP
jgi:TonB family protein